MATMLTFDIRLHVIDISCNFQLSAGQRNILQAFVTLSAKTIASLMMMMMMITQVLHPHVVQSHGRQLLCQLDPCIRSSAFLLHSLC